MALKEFLFSNQITQKNSHLYNGNVLAKHLNIILLKSFLMGACYCEQALLNHRYCWSFTEWIILCQYLSTLKQKPMYVAVSKFVDAKLRCNPPFLTCNNGFGLLWISKNIMLPSQHLVFERNCYFLGIRFLKFCINKFLQKHYYCFWHWLITLYFSSNKLFK